MSAPRDDAVYVGHMLDEALRLQQRFAEVSREEFDANEDLQLVAIQRIQRIGEAARRVSDNFRSEHAFIPWPNIVGMRHRLVHDYLHVDLNLVWEVIQVNIAPLVEQLQTLVSGEDQSGDPQPL